MHESPPKCPNCGYQEDQEEGSVVDALTVIAVFIGMFLFVMWFFITFLEWSDKYYTLWEILKHQWEWLDAFKVF